MAKTKGTVAVDPTIQGAPAPKSRSARKAPDPEGPKHQPEGPKMTVDAPPAEADVKPVLDPPEPRAVTEVEVIENASKGNAVALSEVSNVQNFVRLVVEGKGRRATKGTGDDAVAVTHHVFAIPEITNFVNVSIDDDVIGDLEALDRSGLGLQVVSAVLLGCIISAQQDDRVARLHKKGEPTPTEIADAKGKVRNLWMERLDRGERTIETMALVGRKVRAGKTIGMSVDDARTWGGLTRALADSKAPVPADLEAKAKIEAAEKRTARALEALQGAMAVAPGEVSAVAALAPAQAARGLPAGQARVDFLKRCIAETQTALAEAEREAAAIETEAQKLHGADTSQDALAFIDEAMGATA